MEHAIRLVENFFHRGDDHIDKGDAPSGRTELTEDEKTCYRSALSFLKKEFGRGWMEGGEVVKDRDLPDDPFAKDPQKLPR
jgi:hypothetical protein